MLRYILYTQSHCCWQILSSTTELKSRLSLEKHCLQEMSCIPLNQIYNFVFFKITIDTIFISLPFFFLLSVWDEAVYLVGHDLNVFVRDVFSCILDLFWRNWCQTHTTTYEMKPIYLRLISLLSISDHFPVPVTFWICCGFSVIQIDSKLCSLMDLFS